MTLTGKKMTALLIGKIEKVSEALQRERYTKSHTQTEKCIHGMIHDLGQIMATVAT